MNNTEIWKDIPGYEGIYQVSDIGNVRSLERKVLYGDKPKTIKEKILKTELSPCGYLRVTLCNNNSRKHIKSHMLVTMAFLNHKPDGTNKICIDHINNNKLDNRLVNLQLITNRENTSKDKKDGTSKYVGVRSSAINKWRAEIYINGKTKNLGTFTDEYEAHLAYGKALNEHKNNQHE